MIIRHFVGILIVAILVITGKPSNVSAMDVYRINTTALSIPDDSSLVYSNINISDVGIPDNAVVTGIDVNFTSDHQRSQDLEVSLHYSSLGWTGIDSKYSLWNHEGGNPNPTRTATGIPHFNGIGVKGNWSLYVKDTASGVTGNITSWWIKVYYTSASGPGSTTYSVNASFLNNLTSGHDENSDGYMEDYQFIIITDVSAPAGAKVYTKIICNTTGQSWRSQTGEYNNSHKVGNYTHNQFFNYIKQNSSLTFTIELWDDEKFSNTLLASTSVLGSPINVGVGYFPDGYVSNWVPGSDVDADGYYNTYQLQLGVEGITFADPADVLAKIICTTTGQVWWASAPWTISNVYDYHFFDFSEADFAGYVTGNTTLDFLVELWNPTKTTKLGSTTNYGQIYTGGTLKVDENCSSTINNFVTSNSAFDPYTGGLTSFTADITATPSATWLLNINGEDVATGNTSSVSQQWYGKNLLGQILEPGTYTATLSATDPSGQCTDSKSVTVKVDKKAPPPDCNCEADPNIPVGSTANVTTGGVNHSQTLFSLKGAAFPTSIDLFYDSLNPYAGPLGSGWDHGYNISITEQVDGSILLRQGSGGKSLYTKSGDIYLSPAGDFSTLVKNASGYTITYRDGLKYQFGTDKKLATISDRYGNTLSVSFNPDGDLADITDTAKRKVIFQYDPPHRLRKIAGPGVVISDPDDKKFVFTYNPAGQLWKVTNPKANPDSTFQGYWEYVYYPSGFLKSKRDPNNNITTYTYKNDGRMESSVDPEGLPDANGVATVPGHTRTLSYGNETGNFRTTVLAEKNGGQWTYTYDIQKGQLVERKSPAILPDTVGKTTRYYYDGNGYMKAITVPFDGAKRLTTFYRTDGFGNRTDETDPVEYNGDPATVDVSDFDNAASTIKWARRYDYDTAPGHYDRITGVTDLRGTVPLTTSYVYTIENGGEVVSIIDPRNKGSIIRYNANGTLKETVDANNTVVANNAVTEKTGAQRTTYTYYPDTTDNSTAGIVGLPQTVTPLDKVTVKFTGYDRYGNVTGYKTTDSTNIERPVATTDGYDALSRMKSHLKHSSATPPAFPDSLTTYDYDQYGNVKVKDGEQNASTTSNGTSYLFNYSGQVTRIIDEKLEETRFAYGGDACPSCGGGVDKLTGVWDAKFAKNTPLTDQPHTSYLYNQLSRLEKETDPLGKQMRYTYYDSGLVKEKYDATGGDPGTLLLRFEYNNRGQLTKRIDYHTTPAVADEFEYYSDGKLRYAWNQNISYEYLYYDNGTLHTVTDKTNNRVISYDEYDNLGQRQKVTILKGSGADERVISYVYDGANRPWKITSGAGLFTYLYDTLGRRDTLTYLNGTAKTDWDFDDLNRLTAVKHLVGTTPTTVFNYDQFDLVGNRKRVTGSRNETYHYDELYRLDTVTPDDPVTGRPEDFTYDAAGNRRTGPTAADNAYVPNAANQLITGRKLGYEYDASGNQTKRNVAGEAGKSWKQTWDNRNRLVKVEKTKGTEKRTVTFTYDPLGRRIGKQVIIVKDGAVAMDQSWSYLYDADNIAVEYFTENNATTKTFFTHGPGVDEHLALERGGEFFYYHADGLGSVATIIDQTAKVKMRYDYDSFGKVKSTEYDANGVAKPLATFLNSYTYTGREWDPEVGLHYYRARYYDPMEGRFISKDPIGFAGGINLYGYVKNNPINWADPFGLWDPDDAAAYLLDKTHGWRGTVSKGKCAKAVRLAINAGGVETPNNPVPAKDYMDYLPDLGFEPVSLADYKPQVGDIAVFPAIKGNSYGHIEMYTGKGWQSDYVQPKKTSDGSYGTGFFANNNWRKHPFTIFRYGD